MSLSSVSINRPVLSTVFAIVILLFGIVGVTYLGVREFPSVDPAIISVSTSYPGANSDVIETQITEPLEQSINGIPGVRSLSSVSRQGGSNITVEFELSVDLETAANDVRDKVSQAMRLLPRDCDPPIVFKADADANPILFLTVESSKRSLLQLSEIADLTLKQQLQTISGVSAVSIFGGWYIAGDRGVEVKSYCLCAAPVARFTYKCPASKGCSSVASDKSPNLEIYYGISGDITRPV